MKYSLENKIKEQLEARKINPSQEAWEKIETRLNQEKPKPKSQKLLLWLAASLVLFISIIIGTQTSTDPTPMVQKQPKTKRLKTTPQLLNKPLNIVENTTLPNHSTSKKNIKEHNPQPKIVKTTPKIEQLPLIKAPEKSKLKIEVADTIPPTKTSETAIASNVDTNKQNEKKQAKTYVNPDILLFSVEHEAAIEKTKEEKSNVAKIDLNKK